MASTQARRSASIAIGVKLKIQLAAVSARLSVAESLSTERATLLQRVWRSHPLVLIGLPLMVLVMSELICTEAVGHTPTRQDEHQEKQRETTTPMSQASGPDPEKTTTAARSPWQGREASADTNQLAMLLHKQNVTLWMPLPHWLNDSFATALEYGSHGVPWPRCRQYHAVGGILRLL